ncbi:MAG: beta-ketoacyl-[acyl-carrier-protein] synthase family protein [Pirellulales bacterium]
MRRRIVVTGVGCVTPIGNEVGTFSDNLLAGRSGIGHLTVFDASRFPVRIAAEVRDWHLQDVGEDPLRWRHCPRQTRFAVGAALQAAQQAEIRDARINPLRMGVYLGCGEPFEEFDAFTSSVCSSLGEAGYQEERFLSCALRLFDPETEREFEPDMPGIHLASILNAQGPNANCIAACASSTQAIGEAARIVRRGEADVMICGGAHSTIHPFGVTGFHRLAALSSNSDPATAARPFDIDRDGFVIGEGAAIFILEELEHARRRGAEILAEVSGYGSSQDAFRVTDVHPQGRGTVAAIERALADARLNPEDIDYINAHGTGTVLNDKVETLALKRVFGSHAYRVPVSSTKSMLGHATTACGAIELAVCLTALRRDAIPPTVNHEKPDPDCDLDYVPRYARELRCTHILSDNIGFGGQNAALVVSRFDEPSRSIAASKQAA